MKRATSQSIEMHRVVDCMQGRVGTMEDSGMIAVRRLVNYIVMARIRLSVYSLSTVKRVAHKEKSPFVC